MKMFQLYQTLQNSSKVVFTLNDIARYKRLSKESTRVFIYRMKRQGLLNEVKKGFYSIEIDPILLATQIYTNSYISYTAGFYLHGIINQIPSRIETIVPTQVHPNIDWLIPITYPPKKIFGIEKQRYGNYFIQIGELEKIIVDSLYRRRCPIGYIIDAIPKANKRKLLKYAAKMNLATLKRVGYLLDYLGFEVSSEYIPRNITGVDFFDPNNKEKGFYNRKWRIYINEAMV